MSEKTCGTCRYFGPVVGGTLDYYSNEIEVMNEKFHVCQLLKHLNGSKRDLDGAAGVIDGSGYQATFCVSEEFGCNQWESPRPREWTNVSEWKPIETAPKDGRIIIGWSAGWESPTAIQWVPELSYQNDDGPVFVPGDWDWNGTIQCPPSHDPTHWMPLPAPPATPGEG